MPRTYTNPVYDGYFADPFAFRHEGIWYAVGTGPTSDPDRVFPMLRSADFVEWSPVGAALVRPDEGLGTDFWAPEIAFCEGKFYLYYSVGVGDKGHQLRVATSDMPEGPYEDVAALTRVDEIPFAIDASPFRDEDGTWYLYYAVDFLDTDSGLRAGTALVVDRLESMTRLSGAPQTVLRATQDWQRYLAARSMYGGVYDWHTLEGPCVVKRDGRYYCFYSGGNWQNETYGVDYAVADHPLGPFVTDPVEVPRILRTVPGHVIGPGHNSVVEGPDGELFIVYHAWDSEGTSRRMCVDRLVWTPEGPRCLGPSWTPQSL